MKGLRFYHPFIRAKVWFSVQFSAIWTGQITGMADKQANRKKVKKESG
jgi:hypothetical protein